MKIASIYITLIFSFLLYKNASSCDVDYLLDIGNVSCNSGVDGSIVVRSTKLSKDLPYTYSLNNSAYTKDSSFVNLPAGTYTLSIRDNMGCETIHPQNIQIAQPEAIDLKLKYSPTICGNDAKVFAEISGGVPPYLYTWNNDISLGMDTLRNVNDGFFQLEIKDQNSCTATDTLTIPLEDIFHVTIDVADTEIQLGDVIDLNTSIVKGSGNYSYQWYPNMGAECTTCEFASYRLYKSTFISLIVHDLDYGCVSTDSVFITTSGEFNLFIPNAFSPNNDGRNDIFKIYGVGIDSAFITIFDKNGFAVYKGDAINDGWDGAVSSMNLPEGLYFYQAHVRYIDGSIDNTKGQITLIR